MCFKKPEHASDKSITNMLFIYSVFSQQGAVDVNYNQPSHMQTV